MYMCIFNKINGANQESNTPFNNLKKFFNMSKITTFKPVLQRDGIKNSHVINYQLDINFYRSLG
jgi:hypothetical protein